MPSQRLLDEVRSVMRKLRWQYVFPAATRAVDPRSTQGKIRRHHLDQSVVNKAIKKAVGLADIDKRVSAHTFRHYSACPIMPNGRLALPQNTP